MPNTIKICVFVILLLLCGKINAEDQYENNNRLEDAFDISSYHQTWLSDISGRGELIDDDWFKLIAPEGSSRLNIDFRHWAELGLIGVELFGK
jgi:hypothetical protein